MPGLWIESRGGLIQDEQLRVVDQRPGQTQSPLHAPRQRLWLVFGFVGEGRKLEQQRNALHQLALGQAKITAKHEQIFYTGEVRVQGVKLTHHAQAGLDEQRLLGHLRTKGPDLACFRRQQSQQHLECGGLACPVGTNDAQALPRVDLKAHRVDHSVLPKRLLQSNALEQGLALINTRVVMGASVQGRRPGQGNSPRCMAWRWRSKKSS